MWCNLSKYTYSQCFNLHHSSVCVCVPDSLLSVANTVLLTLPLRHDTRFPGWYRRAKGLLGNTAESTETTRTGGAEGGERRDKMCVVCEVWWDVIVRTLGFHLSDTEDLTWIAVHSQMTPDYTVEHTMAGVACLLWERYCKWTHIQTGETNMVRPCYFCPTPRKSFFNAN